MKGFRRSIVLTLLIITILPAVTLAAAQGEESQIKLRLSRDFGTSLGGLMQGKFSFKVSDAENLAKVAFLIDDEIIGEDDQAPFQYSFNTGDYDLGLHSLSAVGYTADGQELYSNAISRQFIPGSSVTWIVVVIVALVVGFRLLSAFLTRQKGSQRAIEGDYGIYGGTVCPNCGRPFSRHWWGLNLVAGKLDRCPHCGKFNLIQRASPAALEAAEEFARELDGKDVASSYSGDEEAKQRQKLQDQIEQSKYQDK